MPEFYFQYRREQRAEFSVTADTEEQAREMANSRIQKLKLDSPDDCSDDPGETALLEVYDEDGKLIEDWEVDV